ncbi:MAG TPA: putative ABC transporter permease, partial [Anaerovoracaceae bacterium]|nr:putative ABC transporter permease [Anaerovoracaceae bacterium]
MLLNLTCYFIIYAFLGWCTEVVYAAAKTGQFVNRGFLNGPYCPIYGFGVLFVIYLLHPVIDNLLYIFLGSVLITSAIELAGGYILEEIFHQKWWDYSDMPLNIGGYICLFFSLMWGLACLV